MLLVTACAADVIDLPVPDTSLQPLRDDWRVELDVPFDVQAVSRISIGGLETFSNFANRGDVVVNFDAPPGRILIEMRRFSFNRATDVGSDLDRLTLWPYAIDDGLAAPFEARPTACSERWDLDCGVRVHFDGQNQVRTAGADLRVSLPPQFVGELEVVTEDNDDFEYVDAGDVCINGARGVTNVELESGRAWVAFADDVAIAPGCPEEDVVACESGDPPWAFDCPCVQQTGFPASRIRGESADVLVSVPEDYWANLVARAEPPCAQSTDDASVNAPPGAWPDAGHRIEASSGACEDVAFYESPEDWEDGPAEFEQRGNVQLCLDCLRGFTCADLVR